VIDDSVLRRGITFLRRGQFFRLKRPSTPQLVSGKCALSVVIFREEFILPSIAEMPAAKPLPLRFVCHSPNLLGDPTRLCLHRGKVFAIADSYGRVRGDTGLFVQQRLPKNRHPFSAGGGSFHHRGSLRSQRPSFTSSNHWSGNRGLRFWPKRNKRTQRTIPCVWLVNPLTAPFSLFARDFAVTTLGGAAQFSLLEFYF